MPPTIKNIVLVHGAWADGSSWSKVVPLLQAKGFHVVCTLHDFFAACPNGAFFDYTAGKPCEQLKTEIAAKLDAKKIAGYTLDIVDADKAGDAKVVGTCEGGAKKITYAKK